MYIIFLYTHMCVCVQLPLMFLAFGTSRELSLWTKELKSANTSLSRCCALGMVYSVPWFRFPCLFFLFRCFFQWFFEWWSRQGKSHTVITRIHIQDGTAISQSEGDGNNPCWVACTMVKLFGRKVPKLNVTHFGQSWYARHPNIR